ncbi:unnamed protein product [Schistosoma curassoni]|uniref:Ovule protein n=1 Tax=Schistosoma curassoni TaxID=6186 RepID=A0A183JRF0_9TREM|nr:unnamed protein product [Schistosoma curassoni]
MVLGKSSIGPKIKVIFQQSYISHLLYGMYFRAAPSVQSSSSVTSYFLGIICGYEHFRTHPNGIHRVGLD